MFKTPEYQHLLAAERVLVSAIDADEAKLSERSQCARALVDLIRLKRDMRGVPDPRPVDVSQKVRKRRTSSESMPTPTDPTATPPAPPGPAPQG